MLTKRTPQKDRSKKHPLGGKSNGRPIPMTGATGPTGRRYGCGGKLKKRCK